MERVSLSALEAKKYFSLIQSKSHLSYIEIAESLNVSPRTLRDWRNSVYTFSVPIANKIKQKYNIILPTSAYLFEEREVKSKSGRIGAIKRYAMYGNPGTAEGRSKGGLNSLAIHQKFKTGFYLRKSFKTPEESDKLAEFIGIILGDGGVTINQLRVTLNSIDDEPYSKYIVNMIFKLFGEYPMIQKRRGNTLEVVISGRTLIEMIVKKGLVIGNKVVQNVGIPGWISKSNSYRQSVLRGLFDTDGSVYLDRHSFNGNSYKSICVAFTNYSPSLLGNINENLLHFGFSPTASTKNRIMLRHRKEVLKFFREINPRNIKHKLRLKRFLEA